MKLIFSGQTSQGMLTIREAFINMTPTFRKDSNCMTASMTLKLSVLGLDRSATDGDDCHVV